MEKGENSEAFYRIPKFLFSDKYKNILSTDAKLLYALLLDRASLSAKNGWISSDGRVFIYFTVAEASECLVMNKNKMTRLFKELVTAGLIERKNRGLGKSSVIYLSANVEKCLQNVDSRIHKNKHKSPQNVDSGVHENWIQESTNLSGNNTEYNNNYSNKTYLPSKGEWAERLKENVAYDFVISVRPKEKVDSFISLAAETLCGYSQTYRINGADVPCEAVRDRLLSLDEDHIMYAVDVMDDIKWQVKNIRSYMLTVLYNAPDNMEAYQIADFKRTYPYA